MASKKKYDVVATVGKRSDGKPNYVNCGVVVHTDKGFSLKLNSIPAGNEWNGWFGLYEPKPREEAPPRQEQAPPPDFDDSDVPF